MYEISRPSTTIRLLHWNKELPTASAADPLGLNLRVSARLAAELFHCITSITPRARYYSFFPWAFQDYTDHEHEKSGDRGRVEGVLAREKAMVLGAVLHHEGAACVGGSLGGSDKAVDLAKKNLSTYELAGWRHLKAAEGQYGAAYKASLINLGVFKTDVGKIDDEAEVITGDLGEQIQSIEVMELSALGKRLAAAFHETVKSTEYVAQRFTRQNKVPSDVLTKFGAVAGLCEILNDDATDRDVLRNVFFARYDDMTQPGHQRRRMSLLLLLDCIGKSERANVAFGNEAFANICYYGALLDDDGVVSLANVPPRWQTFAAGGVSFTPSII